MRKICWIDLGPYGQFLPGAPASSESWQDHGLGLLRTILHRHGVYTEVESVKNHLDIDTLMPRLRRFECLLMNVRSYNFWQARDIARRFKEMLPSGLVIVGGMHASVNLEEMKAETAFDRICVGPGESIVVDLVSHPEKFERVVQGVAAARMDDWPPIDRRLWPRPLHGSSFFPLEPTVPTWNPPPVATVLTSRVCPWRCSFCNEASYIDSISRRSVDSVIDELNRLDIDHGPLGSVVIHDSMFFQQPAWLEEWLEKYPRRARKVWPYWAAARADTVRRWPELFSRLVLETNWNIVSIGLESGSDRTLLTLNKECTAQDNLFAIGLINQLGDEQQGRGVTPVKLFSNVMFGVPGETREDVLDTMAMVSIIKRQSISPSLYAPYPGGALGYQLIAEGKSLLDTDSMNRNPDRAKAEGVDYEFIRACWRGEHAAAVAQRRPRWLASKLDARGGIPKIERFGAAQSLFSFPMKNGKVKISWGSDAEQAAQVLRIRLTPEELEQVDFSAARKHNQRQLQSLVPDLG
jgi:anaerobic magnesium-protoporphyrin IX monomethyl ester cyclase